MFVVVLVVSFFSFFLLFFLPGTSAEIRAGLEGSNIINQKVTKSGVVTEYWEWLTNAVHGNLGSSEHSYIPVTDIISKKWVNTIILAFFSVGITLLFAVLWCGSMQILSRNRSIHPVLISIILGGFNLVERVLISFIPLTLAIVMLLLASFFRVKILGATGINQLWLPLLTMVLIQLPLYIRSLKESIRQIINSRFVDFAYSLGFSHNWVLWREVMPHAILYTLTLSILQLSYLVGGTIIIEKLFSVSGLGSALVDAVMSRDKIVVQAIILFTTMMIGLVHVCFASVKYGLYGKGINE